MRKNILFMQKVLGLLVASLAVMSVDLAAATAANYETPPVLEAGDVLSDGLLRSANHQVLEQIQYDGYLFKFGLETDYGSEMVTSKALLKIRVHEATVIAEASNALLQRTKLTEPGMIGQAGGRDYLTARSADPQGDLGGEVQFSQIRLSGKKKTAPKRPAGDSVTDILHGGSLPGSDPALEDNKRAIAARLEMDAYTSNEVAQDLLNKLARARASGKSEMGAGFIVERDPETKLANDLVAADVRRALKDYTRDELRALNDRRLAGLMIPAELRLQFLDHSAFSPRHKTFIVAYLERLGNVAGHESFLLAALAAENETQALFYEQWARMLAVYDEQVEALVKLSSVGSTVVAHTASGVLVLAQPVDIVYWSAHFDSLTDISEKSPGGKVLPGRELVVTGMVTATARRELEGRGYTIRDRFLTRR